MIIPITSRMILITTSKVRHYGFCKRIFVSTSATFLSASCLTMFLVTPIAHHVVHR